MGDRMALGITTILTIMFLLGSLNATMPRVSYPKALDWYLLVSFTFVFLSLIECMVVFILTLRSGNDKDKSKYKVTVLPIDHEHLFWRGAICGCVKVWRAESRTKNIFASSKSSCKVILQISWKGYRLKDTWRSFGLGAAVIHCLIGKEWGWGFFFVESHSFQGERRWDQSSPTEYKWEGMSPPPPPGQNNNYSLMWTKRKMFTSSIHWYQNCF